VLSQAELEHHGKPPPPPVPSAGHDWGPPPAQWNTLHVNGVRQVRARFPNGDPQDNSGICFSKINRGKFASNLMCVHYTIRRLIDLL